MNDKNQPTKITAKALKNARTEFEKLTAARSRQQTHVAALDSETRKLAEDHRAAATDAAVNGEPAPAAPSRLAQATAELETANSVMADLRERAAAAEQAVQKAEFDHTKARRREVTAKLEKQAQTHFRELAEAFVKLIEVSGADGWNSVKLLANYTVLHDGKHPVDRALRSEGLTNGEGADSFAIVPEGSYIMDYSDRASTAHNGEQPEYIKTSRL